MRIMGLDVGTKTIGVALSDPTAAFAQPAGVVRRTSMREDLAHLTSLMRENDVGQVVVGLPRNMDGSLGESAARAKRLAEAIEERAGMQVTLWDERLSTVSAERALIEGDVSRRRRKGLVDSVAAAVILQGYLDRRAAAHAVTHTAAQGSGGCQHGGAPQEGGGASKSGSVGIIAAGDGRPGCGRLDH